MSVQKSFCRKIFPKQTAFSLLFGVMLSCWRETLIFQSFSISSFSLLSICYVCFVSSSVVTKSVKIYNGLQNNWLQSCYKRWKHYFSGAPNHFGIGERKDRYYGKVIQLIENQNSARVKFSLKIIFSFRGNSTPQSS